MSWHSSIDRYATTLQETGVVATFAPTPAAQAAVTTVMKEAASLIGVEVDIEVDGFLVTAAVRRTTERTSDG